MRCNVAGSRDTVGHGQREHYLGAARDTAKEVGVHVPEARHEKFARRIDDAGRLRDPGASRGPTSTMRPPATRTTWSRWSLPSTTSTTVT